MPKKSYKKFLKKAEFVRDTPSSIKTGQSKPEELGSLDQKQRDPKETMITTSSTVATMKSADKPNILRGSFVVNQMTAEEARKITKSMDDEVQKEYDIHGFTVCVEWPAGQPRMYGKNQDKVGKTSTADYGFFKGTKGADGGGVDVYVGPSKESKNVYLLLQKPTSWDAEHGMIEPEQKYMLGFGSMEEACLCYKNSMPEEWFFSIGEVSFEDFCQVIKVAKDRKSPIISKAISGIGFDSAPDAEKKAYLSGLIILPEDVKGTNCGNCKFYAPNKENQKIGHCTHRAVDQTIGEDFCCNFWDHEGAKTSSLEKSANGELDPETEWYLMNMGGPTEKWSMEKSNGASSDWRTGFRNIQEEMKKYLGDPPPEVAAKQTDHTAELSADSVEKPTDKAVKGEVKPRATSEGVMSREHERKANRTPLVRNTRVKDFGRGEGVPLMPNKKKSLIKSLFSPILEQYGDDEVKIVFEL